MRGTVALIVASVSISALVASDAAAATPLQTVQEHVSYVVAILQDTRFSGAANMERRQAELDTVVNDLFDLADMAHRAIGPNRACCSASELLDLTRLVQNVLQRSYVRTMENYAGGSIEYEGETIDGPYATVKSRIVMKRGLDVSVDYRLYASTVQDSWKVFDVALEGCSVIANYRAQFDRIIHSDSVAGLIERLRQKDAELMAVRPHLGEDRARGPALLLAPFLGRRRR